MDVVVLILTIIGVVVAIVFGFLQVIVPFVKREVRLSNKSSFVKSPEAGEKSGAQPLVDPFLAVSIMDCDRSTLGQTP